jgi:hypothetical protein
MLEGQTRRSVFDPTRTFNRLIDRLRSVALPCGQYDHVSLKRRAPSAPSPTSLTSERVLDPKPRQQRNELSLPVRLSFRKQRL